MDKKSVFNPHIQANDLSSKIVGGLDRISEAFKVLLWEKAKHLGLSPIQIRILLFTAYHQPQSCTISKLADEFNLTKPTISDAVRVLKEKGLIGKIYSTSDNRSFTISLSASGQEAVNLTEGFAGPIVRIMDSYPLHQREVFFEVLSDLIHRLNAEGILTVQRSCSSCRFYSKKPLADYCTLLEKTLLNTDIRLDCPEFQPR